MKRLFTLLVLIAVKVSAQCPWNYTLFTYGGNFSITCSSPTLQINAVCNNSSSINYTWTGPSFSTTGNPAYFTQAGTYTVVGTDPTTSCSISKTISVGINTIAPTSTLIPINTTVACNGVPVSFTATALTPSANVQHKWYSPFNSMPAGVPILSTNSSTSVLSGALPPGVYTVVSSDFTNGCKASKLFTITSTQAYPTYSTMSPSSFTLGCAPLNQTTLSIVNPVSTQTPPATCSYTFLEPTFVGVVSPSIILSATSSTVTQVPGTWTVIVQDNSNFCRTELWVPVMQNSIQPNVSVSMLTADTLSCKNPTIFTQGWSSTYGTDVTWLLPIPPPNLSQPTLVIGDPNFGPNTSTNSLFYSNYTIVATNTINACQTTSVIPVYQNFKPPVASPAIATPGFICDEYAQLVIGNSTVTSGVPGASVMPLLWEGPNNYTAGAQTFFNVYMAGIYSLTVQDSYNGCTKTGTISITDQSPLFTLQGSPPTSSVSCNGTVFIQPTVAAGYSISISTGSLNNLTVNNLCYGQLKVCLTYTATGCRKCDSIMMNQFTSIRENIFEKDFLLYPNPAQSSFFIEMENEMAQIKVMDAQGRSILNKEIRSGENISLETFSSGIYFIEVR